jgi:hypothetical protein
VGQPGATIQAGGRVFHVLPGGDLRLNTMTLEGRGASDDPGGGNILNRGQLTAQSVLIRNGHANTQGGNISNFGTMDLSDVTVSGGSAQYVGGAGIYNAPGADATITRAGITGNECDNTCQGGGVLNRGTMSIIDSTLEGNFSVNGSNVNNAGSLTIRGSRFVGGPMDEAQPGGISNSGTLSDEGGNDIS